MLTEMQNTETIAYLKKEPEGNKGCKLQTTKVEIAEQKQRAYRNNIS